MGKLDLIKNLAMNSSALAVTKVNSKTAEKIVTSPTLKVQPKDAFVKSCECSFKFDDSKCVVFGEFPKEYVNIEKFFVEAKPEHISRILKKVVPAEPAHWETSQTIKPSYYISHLFSHGKGQGTDAVKSIVQKSLNDTRTCGRVTLQSDIIDGKTSPSGFYYKLGFRFPDSEKNKIMQKWLENGGQKATAPLVTGFMYLPKENIPHCLNY